MKILGIDYGEKYVGLAVADTENNFVSPYKVVQPESEAELFSNIEEALLDTGSRKIVLGLPLGFHFRRTKFSLRVKEFGARLKARLHRQARFKIPVEYENEILTSALAAKYLGMASRRRKESRNHAFSAALILESYLERIRARKAL